MINLLIFIIIAILWLPTTGAAEGEWEDLETYPDKVLGILRVTPGTERNALFRIIFHRGILWADFHRFGQVITNPR